jgi:hypothetical protein
MESEIKGAYAFVLNKQATPGASAFEERHSRQRLACVDRYRVGRVGEIAAAKVSPIQVDGSSTWLTSKYVNADPQPQQFQLRTACLAEQARKRAGVFTSRGLGAKVDAIVFSEYGATRQQSHKKREKCDL